MHVIGEITLNIDTLLFQNSTVNFWIKNLTANGYIFIREDENNNDIFTIRYIDENLVIKIQSLEFSISADNEAMITIITDAANATVKIYKDISFIGEYELIANIISENGDNIISEDGDNIISEGLITFTSVDRSQ
jgi:hypothetical protein